MYEILILPRFLREVKKYIKKYPALKEELIVFLEKFRKEESISLGNNVYKLRFKSKLFPKGSSKSFRLIVFFLEVDNILAPAFFYYKGDKENITKKELNDRLEEIFIYLKSLNL